MDREELINAIMAATDCSNAEAMNTILEMVERIEEGENPEELLYEIGLEPDYVLTLLDFVAD